MRISNPAIYQYLSGTVNRNQQPDRFPVRPEPIEGQLINDEKKQSETNTSQSFREPEQSNNETQAELIAPATAPQIPQTIAPDSVANALLVQQKLSDNPAILSQNGAFSAAPNFPYGHRRSFAGLAGGSLVIQNYLNNELPALTQADNSQRNIDFFI